MFGSSSGRGGRSAALVEDFGAKEKGEAENEREEETIGPLRASRRAGRPRDLAIEAIAKGLGRIEV